MNFVFNELTREHMKKRADVTYICCKEKETGVSTRLQEKLVPFSLLTKPWNIQTFRKVIILVSNKH